MYMCVCYVYKCVCYVYMCVLCIYMCVLTLYCATRDKEVSNLSYQTTKINCDIFYFSDLSISPSKTIIFAHVYKQ